MKKVLINLPFLLITLLLATSSFAFEGNCNITDASGDNIPPYTFENGKPANALEVNKNFDCLYSEAKRSNDSLQQAKTRYDLRVYQPGNFLWHMPFVPGARTITEMQQKGWAICDGTTVVSQLVDSGFFQVSELAITGDTPDLISNRLFIRSDASSDSGIIETDTTKRPVTPFVTDTQGSHTHGYSHGRVYYPGRASGSYQNITSLQNATTGAAGNHQHTITGGGDLETRPKNISAVPMIFTLVD